MAVAPRYFHVIVLVSQSLQDRAVVACIVVSSSDPDTIWCRFCCTEWRPRLRWWLSNQLRTGDDDQRWLWDIWGLFCLRECLVEVVFVEIQQRSTCNRDLGDQHLGRLRWSWNFKDIVRIIYTQFSYHRMTHLYTIWIFPPLSLNHVIVPYGWLPIFFP